MYNPCLDKKNQYHCYFLLLSQAHSIKEWDQYLVGPEVNCFEKSYYVINDVFENEMTFLSHLSSKGEPWDVRWLRNVLESRPSMRDDWETSSSLKKYL
jgi:hypothetical protein